MDFTQIDLMDNITQEEVHVTFCKVSLGADRYYESRTCPTTFAAIQLRIKMHMYKDCGVGAMPRTEIR